MTERILLIGGTGETGRLVLNRLVENGDRVRALYRSQHQFPEQVEPVQGDVRDADVMSRACRDTHTVISCLGNRRYFGKSGMFEVDVVGTRNLGSACAEHGVEHFILLSAFGLDRKSVFLSLFSAVLNRYFHHKKLVEEAVRDSGVPFTFVRPHELRNRPPRGLPVLNQTEQQPLLQTVSRHTVADVLAACPFEDRVINTVFEVTEGGEAPLEAQLDGLVRDGKMHLESAKTPLC